MCFLHTGATAAVAAVAFYCTSAFEWAGAASARADIVVGVAVPSSGLKRQMGREIRSAAEHEVARINAAGGIDGEMVRLTVEDDDCTAQGGARVAASFVQQRAALVLGHPCSNAAMAAAKTYAAAAVWFVTIGAGHPDLTAKRAGPTVFRLGGRDDRQARDTVAVLVANLPGKRIAIVHDRTSYARTLADGVARGLKAAGQVAIAIEGIVAGKMHYSDLAGRLKSARVDAIYFAGFPTEYEILNADLKALGFEPQVIASDAVAGDATLHALEPHRLADHSPTIMARNTALAVNFSPLVLISLGAFKASARNLASFSSMLGVDTNGDSHSATFMPAAWACSSGDCR